MEAGKENEQTLANLSPTEEATNKNEVEIEKLRITSFSSPLEVPAAKRKNLARQVKGNRRPNVIRELTEAEEEALFENGQFGLQDLKSLQRSLFRNFSLSLKEKKGYFVFIH